MLAGLLLVATLLISFLSGYQIYRRFYEAKQDEALKNLKFLEYVAETYQSSVASAADYYIKTINVPIRDLTPHRSQLPVLGGGRGLEHETNDPRYLDRPRGVLKG
jgi:hypothetical protein